MYWKIDWFFNWLFMGFWSILGPKNLPKPVKITRLSFAGELLEGVLVPLGPKMGSRWPPDPSQVWFLWILDPNLLIFCIFFYVYQFFGVLFFFLKKKNNFFNPFLKCFGWCFNNFLKFFDRSSIVFLSNGSTGNIIPWPHRSPFTPCGVPGSWFRHFMYSQACCC